MNNFGDWQSFDSILCVRPDNLGDVLMTAPALQALKAARPGRRITLLTSHAGAAIARHVDGVDALTVFDPPWYRHAEAAGRETVRALIDELAAQRFDAAVIFTVFSQNPLPTAMLCYQAGIPRIAGYCRENPYQLITDWLPDTEPLYGARHEVQRQLDLVTALGAQPADAAMSLRLPSRREARVTAALQSAGVDVERRWLLLHPGASESRRRYPAERFAAAARRLASELDMQVVLTGTAEERELCGSIAAQAGEDVHVLAGALDLDDFLVLVAMAPVLISNNTGPVHIAAAVQTPVVVLYALTNPQHAPWGVAHRVLPFDVPPEARSRNVIVRYAGERFFQQPAGMAAPDDIVSAVAELMDTRDAQTLPTELVATGVPRVSVEARS